VEPPVRKSASAGENIAARDPISIAAASNNEILAVPKQLSTERIFRHHTSRRSEPLVEVKAAAQDIAHQAAINRENPESSRAELGGQNISLPLTSASSEQNRIRYGGSNKQSRLSDAAINSAITADQNPVTDSALFKQNLRASVDWIETGVIPECNQIDNRKSLSMEASSVDCTSKPLVVERPLYVQSPSVPISGTLPSYALNFKRFKKNFVVGLSVKDDAIHDCSVLTKSSKPLFTIAGMERVLPKETEREIQV
jgi:hypothetical protein